MRKLSAFVATLVAALVVTSAAAAATITIRVEGKTTTIFAPAGQKVTATNALDALEAASVAGEFYYAVSEAQFGRYVSQIGKYPAAGSAGWVFKVNGVSPPVGADQVVLKDGDQVLWYWAEFGPSGGPKTLSLQRLPGNCYRVMAVDDQGKSTVATGAVLRVGSKTFRTRAGRACIGKHTGLVRATLAGHVRSNAVA
jgi:hypothetical protein